jgi:hypothetical protein
VTGSDGLRDAIPHGILQASDTEELDLQLLE